MATESVHSNFENAWLATHTKRWTGGALNRFLALGHQKHPYGNLRKMLNMAHKYVDDAEIHLVTDAERDEEQIVKLAQDVEEGDCQAFQDMALAAHTNHAAFGKFFRDAKAKMGANADAHRVMDPQLTALHKEFAAEFKDLESLRKDIEAVIAAARDSKDHTEFKTKITEMTTDLNALTGLRLRGNMRIVGRDTGKVQSSIDNVLGYMDDVGKHADDLQSEMERLKRYAHETNQSLHFFLRIDTIILIEEVATIDEQQEKDITYSKEHFMPKATEDERIAALKHIQSSIVTDAHGMEEALNGLEKEANALASA